MVTTNPEPTDEGPSRRVAGSSGVTLAVYEQGPRHAPTVLLLHGYPDDHHVWDLVAAELAGEFHVVTYDVRGHGASDAPAERSGYRNEHLIADFVAVADAVSPGRPVHLVAHDWGSIQAWPMIGDPEAATRIASFTSQSGPGLEHAHRWIRRHLAPGQGRWRDLLRQGKRSWYIGMFRTPIASRAWDRGVAERTFRLVLERREGATFDDGWPGPHFRRNGRNGLELYRANFGGRRAADAVPSTVPVQLLVAQDDPYVTPPLLEGIEAFAPTLVRREVGGMHWLPRTRPEAYARWIREHVDAVEGGDRPTTPAAPPAPVVVVTGAGSGIGRAVCLAFAERGAHVVASDLQVATAEETADRCRTRGGTAEAHQLDVTDGDAMETFAAKVAAAHGAPAVVVNNAGLGMGGPFMATTDEDWEQLLDVNLWGVIRGSRAFARQMLDHGTPGHIVNLASAAAFTPSRSLPAYATSKAAVLMLTECLRAELADESIGVSAICPGFVDTGIAMATRYVGDTEADQEAKRVAADRMYKRRHVTPDVVAKAVLRAVDRNLPLVTVAAEAKVGRLTSRFAPRLGRAIARIDLTPQTRSSS